MARKTDRELVVGLDIGTSKVLVVVGEVGGDGAIEITGVGQHESRGMRKGVVTDIAATVQSVERAVEEAELMADCRIYSAFTGIAGSHITGVNSEGVVAIRDNEVRATDIERVIESARALPIPTDQRILHILPQEFIIDGQEGIREPIGMSGVRLEAKVHIVTGALSAAQNITKCVERCGLKVDDIILQQLASAEAVLTDDDRELGVCLVDIGAGTTDIAVFCDGAIRHTKVIPIAGSLITNDIAIALQTPTKQAAESIKQQHGCALAHMAGDDVIDVPSAGDRPARQVSRSTLAEVIEVRVEELYSFVEDELRRSGYDGLIGAGIVLTGGSASMQGMVELAEEVFHKPVRLGVPSYQGSLAETVNNPAFATALGLIRFGKSHREPIIRHGSSSDQTSFFGRLKKWFVGNF